MLKKIEICDEDEEGYRGKRIGSKFSGFGMKVEKMFRAAFRKDNISQSRQQPPIEMVEELNGSDGDVRSNVEKKKRVIERSKGVTTSEYSSDFDFGSRTNLIKQLSKSNDSVHEVLDDDCNKNTPVLNTRKMWRLKRSEHVQSNDSESKSMNVVVDIHRENVNSKLSESVNKPVVNIFSDEHESENDLSVDVTREKSFNASFENPTDSIKKQRKRWSKETNVILPPKRNSISSTSVSDRSSNWMEVDAISQPVAAPRLRNIISDNEGEKNNYGLDNEAFEHENNDRDQILTIETEYDSAENMKKKVRSSKNESDESNRKQNASEDNEKSTDHSSISDIEEITEIRQFSSENARIHREINSEIESGISDKRKSSSVSSGEENRISRRSFKNISITENSTSSMSDMQVIDEVPKCKGISKKNKKIKRRNRSTSSTYNSNTSGISKVGSKSSGTSDKVDKKKNKLIRDDENKVKYISIMIHRADALVADYITRHPMVIVHIVEESTGNYLKVSSKIKDDSVYLQPLITGMYDFKANKSMLPYWDEELIFEHDFNAILNAEKNQVLILFEIVDLPSVADASSTYDRFGGHDCWYKIAWAFLKPMSLSGIHHVDKVVRLQLYKPKRNLKKIKRYHCEPYRWWKCGYREKYSSTLFVTVTSIDPPKLEPVFYGHLTLDEMPDEQIDLSKSITVPSESGNLSRWSRLAAQSCKIPNEIFFKTEMSDNGSFYVVFSNNGKYLACATYDEYDYPIVVYEMNEGKVHTKFLGHKSFIYALDWSHNDEILLSVSSDQTARIWDIKNKIIQEVNMLPHPSYVYCGKFSPANPHLIVTGCYDHATRLWSRRKNSDNYELIQELDGHEGFVNSICFLKDGDFLTADSVGVIIQWTVKKRKGKPSRDWQITKKIRIREIKNVTINTIAVHPLGSRLLVHSRDNGLRMLDLTTGVVLQRYMGLKNTRIQIAAKISPCGGLLLCGSEDAALNIWNLESCKYIATYATNLPSVAVTCVDYHPYDHVLAYTVFGAATEAFVLRYDKQSNGQSVGLKSLTTEDHNFRNVNDIESVQTTNRTNQRFQRRIINDSVESKNEYGDTKQLLTSVNHEDLRSKLRQFNDSDGQLKIRSANRLTSIIAKIDKILSNSGSTHRTLYDVEANRLDDTLCEGRTIINSPMQQDKRMMMRPYVPPLFSTFEDNSTCGTKSDTVEMTDLSGSKSRTVLTTNRGKSKSARDYHPKVSERNSGQKLKTTMSDSAMSSMASRKKSKSSHKTMRDVANGAKVLIMNDSVTTNIPQRSSSKDGHDESSAESGGTYVLEKSDIGKMIESESSSVRSNVTFVIESEKPVPKPRRKRTDYKQDTIVQIE